MDGTESWAMQDPARWLQRQSKKAQEGINLQFPLRVAAQMFPTPLADGDRATNYAQGGTSLGFAARNFPTPTAHNAKEGAYPSEYNRNIPTLATHDGGKLNPTWVAWLMGWPLAWTDLKPLAMDKYQQWQRLHGACLEE